MHYFSLSSLSLSRSLFLPHLAIVKACLHKTLYYAVVMHQEVQTGTESITESLLMHTQASNYFNWRLCTSKLKFLLQLYQGQITASASKPLASLLLCRGWSISKYFAGVSVLLVLTSLLGWLYFHSIGYVTGIQSFSCSKPSWDWEPLHWKALTKKAK